MVEHLHHTIFKEEKLISHVLRCEWYDKDSDIDEHKES